VRHERRPRKRSFFAGETGAGQAEPSTAFEDLDVVLLLLLARLAAERRSRDVPDPDSVAVDQLTAFGHLFASRLTQALDGGWPAFAAGRDVVEVRTTAAEDGRPRSFVALSRRGRRLISFFD
jgi:hypothetical protein